MKLLWILLACVGGDDATDTEPSETETEPSASDTESSTDTETREALVLRQGSLAYTGSDVTGSERFLVVDVEDKEVFCEVTAAVTGSAALEGCDECDWAFTVTFSQVEVVTDIDGACDAAGMDAAARAELDGEERDYGYSPEHFGHAQVLMAVVDGSWQAVANAEYVDETLSYTWDMGLIDW